MKHTLYTHFARGCSRLAGRPFTFALMVLLVAVWAVSGPIFNYSDTWQLTINTATTIITFLLVALLQNSQTRADAALQHKLNAIATALDDVLEAVNPGDVAARRELRESVGLEEREGS